MSELDWVFVALVTVFSSARFTRLLTYDSFPPVAWFRNRYAKWTDGSDWVLLFFCAFCMSVYVTAAVVLAGWLSGWHQAWWLVNGISGGSYIAAMIQVRDGDDSEDSH